MSMHCKVCDSSIPVERDDEHYCSQECADEVNVVGGAKVIQTYFFDLRLNNGVSYHIECGICEIDDLLTLIGEENIAWCDSIGTEGLEEYQSKRKARKE